METVLIVLLVVFVLLVGAGDTLVTAVIRGLSVASEVPGANARTTVACASS